MTKPVFFICLFRCTFECLSKRKHSIVKHHYRGSPEVAVSKQITIPLTSPSKKLQSWEWEGWGGKGCCFKQDPISIKLVKHRWWNTRIILTDLLFKWYLFPLTSWVTRAHNFISSIPLNRECKGQEFKYYFKLLRQSHYCLIGKVILYSC